MPLLGRPSRSYKHVEHNAEGLSGIGSAPYSATRHSKDNGAAEYTVKTYRPSIAELHFKRQAMHDPHPSSSFQLGRKSKEQARQGQRAELDHILEPGYKTASIYGDEDNASIAGPSRMSSVRTAGGLSALGRRGKDEVMRHSGSVSNLIHGNRSEGGASSARKGGTYIDATGRLHDQEYDPFAGVSEMSRRKSRRRSAFGGHRRGSCSSDSASGSSDSELAAQPRTSFDTRTPEEERERDEIRRRLEVERRRLDEVSGYAAARRRSMMSDRASVRDMVRGNGTPSIRSGHEDAVSLLTANGGGAVNGGGAGFVRAPSRLSTQQLVPPQLTATFEDDDKDDDEDDDDEEYDSAVSPSSPISASPHPQQRHHRAPSLQSTASHYTSGRRSHRATSSAGGGEESPLKHTETTPPEPPVANEGHRRIEKHTPPPPYRDMSIKTSTSPPDRRLIGPDILMPRGSPKAVLDDGMRKETITTIRSGQVPRSSHLSPKPTKQKVERAPDGSTRITGFDAGPPRTPAVSVGNSLPALSVKSVGSSRSSERTNAQPRHKPIERPREQLFPETPAQAKRREEKERRNYYRSARTPGVSVGSGSVSNGHGGDTMTVTASARTRVLPEIEIVEDDDPRIIFPAHGPSTRVQTHEHVIRSHYGEKRLDTSGPTSFVTRSNRGDRATLDGSVRDTSSRSIGFTDGTKPPSVIIEEGGGGYLPTRWAGGDRQLRVTEEEKERYRPTEWGGRKGDLGGRSEEWRPDTKDAVKRNLKDMSTNARFSMFRAKKKLLRKADL